MGDESILTLNLSPRTLEADDFSAGPLVALVRSAGLDPTRVVLELTEREQIEEMERLRRNVTACRSGRASGSPPTTSGRATPGCAC